MSKSLLIERFRKNNYVQSENFYWYGTFWRLIMALKQFLSLFHLEKRETLVIYEYSLKLEAYCYESCACLISEKRTNSYIFL